MNALVTNDGLTTWLGFESNVYATIYFTDRTTGHQCKKVCFDEIEVQKHLTAQKTPGNFFHAYEADVQYENLREVAM